VASLFQAVARQPRVMTPEFNNALLRQFPIINQRLTYAGPGFMPTFAPLTITTTPGTTEYTFIDLSNPVANPASWSGQSFVRSLKELMNALVLAVPAAFTGIDLLGYVPADVVSLRLIESAILAALFYLQNKQSSIFLSQNLPDTVKTALRNPRSLPVSVNCYLLHYLNYQPPFQAGATTVWFGKVYQPGTGPLNQRIWNWNLPLMSSCIANSANRYGYGAYRSSLSMPYSSNVVFGQPQVVGTTFVNSSRSFGGGSQQSVAPQQQPAQRLGGQQQTQRIGGTSNPATQQKQVIEIVSLERIPKRSEKR
jgi:hypothetical protein